MNMETYRKRKEEHLCTKCGKQDERTLSGKTECAKCAENERNAYIIRCRKNCCIKCGKQDERTLSGRCTCEECARKDRERKIGRQLTEEQKAASLRYHAETRRWRREKKRCVDCGRQDERTLSGKPRCAKCNAKANSRARKRKAVPPERRNEYEREKYRRLKEAGLCVYCGKPADGNFVSCIYCRLRRRKYNVVASARAHPGRQGNMLSRLDWKELGLCARCGRPLDGQLKKDGTPSKICSRCYNNMKAAQEQQRRR